MALACPTSPVAGCPAQSWTSYPCRTARLAANPDLTAVHPPGSSRVTRRHRLSPVHCSTDRAGLVSRDSTCCLPMTGSQKPDRIAWRRAALVIQPYFQADPADFGHPVATDLAASGRRSAAAVDRSIAVASGFASSCVLPCSKTMRTRLALRR